MPAAIAIRPLLALLGELHALVARLDDDVYAAPGPGCASGGGVGGHIRHCLDHVTALLSGAHIGSCHYDRRRRGTDVETSRRAALGHIAELRAALEALPSSTLDHVMRVETQLDPSGAMMVTMSSVGREVAFVTSHTVHHNAIVGQILRGRGIDVAPRFGVAASTPSPGQMASPEHATSESYTPTPPAQAQRPQQPTPREYPAGAAGVRDALPCAR
jgi:hypothetical protein